MTVKPIYADGIKHLINECIDSQGCKQCKQKIADLENKVTALEAQLSNLTNSIVEVRNTFGNELPFKVISKDYQLNTGET